MRRLWDEAFNQGRIAVIDGAYAPDCVSHALGQAIEGRDDFKVFIASVLAATPDVRFTLAGLLAEGDRVVVRYTAGGTHRGEFAGVPPTGKPITWTGIVEHRIADGLIREDWAEGFFLAQLGAAPAPVTTAQAVDATRAGRDPDRARPVADATRLRPVTYGL